MRNHPGHPARGCAFALVFGSLWWAAMIWVTIRFGLLWAAIVGAIPFVVMWAATKDS